MSQDLLTQLAEYGIYCDERQPAVSADDVIDAVVPLPMPAPPTAPRRGWLVAVVAAAALLIVIGSVTWLTSFSDSIAPTNEPTETTPETTVPTTPDTTTPPTTLPVGPVEVTVEWTQVTDGNPPLNGPLERGFGPFIITDGSTPRVAVVSGVDGGRLSLWTSDDGIEWVNTAISLPAEPAWLEATQNGYWLMGRDPTALWYSSDLQGTWDAINLDGLVQVAPFPLTWESTSIESVASVGDTTLVVALYEAVFDWDAILGIEPGTYDEYNYAFDGDEESPIEADPDEESPIVTLNGSNAISAGWIDDPLLRFIPTTSAEGLTLTDADSGETLFVFPNLGELDWANVVGSDVSPRFQTEFFTLLEVTPDGVAETGPWAFSLGSLNRVQPIRMLQLDDAVIVETVVDNQTEKTYSDRQRESYLTRDGRTFERIPPPPQGLVNTKHDPISGYLYSGIVDGSFTGIDVLEHWISTDGVNWTTLQTPVVLENWFLQRSFLHRLDGAWMIMKDDGGITEIYVSVDGEGWHAIDPPPTKDLPIPLPSWGNRLLIFSDDSNWIGTVDISRG